MLTYIFIIDTIIYLFGCIEELLSLICLCHTNVEISVFVLS